MFKNYMKASFFHFGTQKAWIGRGKGNKTIVGLSMIEQRFACFNDNEKMLNINS